MNEMCNYKKLEKILSDIEIINKIQNESYWNFN